MESTYGTVFISPVHIEHSIITASWPHFKINSDVTFSLNSPLVPCVLFNVNKMPTKVLKRFCDHSNLTWEHVNFISSRPLMPF